MMQKLKTFMPSLRFSPSLLKMSCLLLLLASSCAGLVQYQRSDVLKQILKPREGFKTLTNRACKTYDEKGCAEFEVKEYDVQKPDVRKLLVALGFVCKVGGKRYKIELNEPKLRRDWIVKCGLFKLKKCRRSEWLDFDMIYLKAANTKCFSSRAYPFNEM